MADPKLTELQNPMQEKIQRILDSLTEQGYQPKISNAYRTAEQQAEKVAQGYAANADPGTHGAGLAADIVDRRYGWNPSLESAKFFAALTDAARAEGLTAGGTWFGQGGTRLKPTHPAVWNKWGVGWDPAHIEQKYDEPHYAPPVADEPHYAPGTLVAQPSVRGLPPGEQEEKRGGKMTSPYDPFVRTATGEKIIDPERAIHYPWSPYFQKEEEGPILKPGETPTTARVTPPEPERLETTPQGKSAQTLAQEALGKLSPTLTLGSTSTVSERSPGYSPETAAAIKESYNRLKSAEAEALGGEAGSMTEPEEPINLAAGNLVPYEQATPGARTWEVKGSGKLGAYDKAINTLKMAQVENDRMLKDAVFSKKTQQGELIKANENLRNIETRISNAEIDPNRFWTGGAPGAAGGVYSLFKGAFAALAVGLGAYAQGLSGGKIPNTAADMINRALDRDMQAQKVNLQKLMSERGYATDQRAYITNRFDMALQQEKAHQLRSTELLLAEGLQGAAKAEVKLEYAKQINKLAREEAIAEELGKPKATSKTTTGMKEVVNPERAIALKATLAEPKPGMAPGGGKMLPANRIGEISKEIGLMGELVQLTAEVRKAAITPITEWTPVAWFGTDAGTVGPKLNAAARVIGRMQGVDKGTFAQSDAKVMTEALRGKEWNKQRIAVQNLNNKINSLFALRHGELDILEKQGYSVAGLRDQLAKLGPRPGSAQVAPAPTGKGIRRAE